MEIPKVPKVFFIKGVFKHTSKPIDQVIHSAPETALQSDHDDLGDQTLPLKKIFTDVADWANQRRIRCTTCRCVIKNLQIFIPEYFESKKPQNTLQWKTYDTCRFHSWPCAAYHVQYFLSNDSRFKLLLKHLYDVWPQENRLDISEIVPSIDPWQLLEFGGSLTHEQFDIINDYNMKKFASSFSTDDNMPDNNQDPDEQQDSLDDF